MVPESDGDTQPANMLTRAAAEAEERERLAPYASLSGASRGRRDPEQPDAFRTGFQRDRDRIIHCTAFRRLLGKTQVFISATGDHFRVRMTHSLEVAQIARSIARVLRLNQDLTEALALAHDLGHAPFGHSGGETLDGLLADEGGFEHNRQALRIVDRIENRYPGPGGLNLTYEVRESIIKHRRPFEGPDYAPYHPEEGPCLEAQVVDEADGIAYNSHDVDDGLLSGILDPDAVGELGLWRLAREQALAHRPRAEGRMLVKLTVGRMITVMVEDLMRRTAHHLSRAGIRSIEDVRACAEPLVGFSPEIEKHQRELRSFLHDSFYTHYKVARMRHRARIIITGLFEAYARGPRMLPPRFQALAREDGRSRAIADYIAGMTDGYAQKEYALLFQGGAGLLDP